MNLEESTNNLKYIKEVIAFLEDIHQNAKSFKLDEITHNSTLERKYLKKLWEVQAETARKQIIEDSIKNEEKIPPSIQYFQKFINIFKDKSIKELTPLEKFDALYNSLDDSNLHTEHKIEFLSTKIEFVSLKSFLPTFAKVVDKVISDHEEYPHYSKRYHLSENDLHTLKLLKFEYLKEARDFTAKDCQKEFKKYLGKAVDSFKKKNDNLKEDSIFNLYDYDPKNLSGGLYIDNLEEIQKLIQEKKIIYKFFLQRYSKDLNDNNVLNRTFLSAFKKKPTKDIINLLDKNTLLFEECNAFTNIEHSFEFYPHTHEQLKEIIFELKKQDLIPHHIEQSIIKGDKEFNIFFKRCVEKQNLHKELIEELPENIPLVKKKPLKV